MRLSVVASVLTLAVAAAVSTAAVAVGKPAPRPVSKSAAHAAPTTGHMLVAAANPLAAKAGMEVLRRGGSAAVAAVAVQAVLGLVEPQSSGVGGGAFMTFYDASAHKTVAYNGRETAPAAATPGLFLGADGKPLPFRQAVVSGRATGVPGAYALLALAQKEHGRLAWRTLFGTAETMADQGFVVSPRLASMIRSNAFPQSSRPDVIAYFTKPDGQKYAAGDRLKNPAYAATLRALATQGTAALYEGPIAQHILAKTHMEPLPGAMSAADLKAYRAKEGPALCRPYRIYVVCVPGAPASGAGLLEALGILERTDIDKRGPNDPRAWYLFAQAQRLMYADRDAYVGDPAFVHVPQAGMIDAKYDASRAKLIGATAPASGFAAGNPPGAEPRGPDATAEPGGTSDFTIVDRWGNVVSMTTTVESIFGTGRMVDGFFLNNQLTDFSFAPVDARGRPVANAVAPGKRPRSSMCPVIVFDRAGRFLAAVGSPGGNSIVAFNLKAVVGVLDWHLSMQQSIALPNLIARGASTYGETEKFAPGVVKQLAAWGVTVQPGGGEDSGLHGAMIRNGRLEGGADPRREGVALIE
ncbi:MAG TPA: gamma-glutamyltransferase family protein [Caulobacteraceae bacterium]|nr:gamma-glutamyltransferase family protein [Caulobacteraceae bacterium]